MPPSTLHRICFSKTPQDALSLRGQDIPAPFDARHTEISVVGKWCAARMVAPLLQSFPLCGMGGEAACQGGRSAHTDGVELLISLK